MLRRDSSRNRTRDRARATASREQPFVLYVEGARDREILGSWSRRTEPRVSRCIEANTVILGGRRPARALADFKERGGAKSGLRGLIVLDRDDHEVSAEYPDLALAPDETDSTSSRFEVGAAGTRAEAHLEMKESGLELFVWGLRHIESYLLVPAAIRRLADLKAGDRRVENLIDEQILLGRSEMGDGGPPKADGVHAKRILGSRGLLTELLGTELRAGDIARAMRADELHADVHALFGKISSLAGLTNNGPEVVMRAPRSDT